MVVFGSKSSSAKTKLFDQPLDKLFNPKAIKDFNETIAASNSRSPPALCQSLSAPLTSSTMTWAKLSQENSATKRKRAAARLRRFTIDANNNTSSLIQSLTSAPIINPSGSSALPLCISHPHQRLESNHSSPTLLPGSMLTNSSFVATNCEWNEREVASREENQRRNEGELSEDERCRLLLNVLPEPIKCLLNEIYHRGPSTVGIFRKSPNAKHCKELKQKLESSDFQLDAIEQYQVNVIASVFKEWLRSLPDCLLMSRLYPQWIDVAKLIEPLHSHLQQQQQQQQLMQQSNDHTPNQNHLSSSSSCEDNLDGNLSKSPNGVQEMASLRSSVLAASPLTDNGQQQSSSENLSPGDGNGQQLSRALSCSIMTSDSGHSSTSTSPSSAMSTSFDSCNETISATEAAARARRQNFQKAQIQSQQLQANQKASYLKRKCYQQRQQQQLSSIDCKSESGQINSLISGNVAADGTQQSNQHRQQQVSMSMEFSLRERRFECIRVVRQLLEALNETNLILLRAIICVLWHIADNSDYNKMSSNNLGVCIGQSLLNDELQQQQHNNSLQHRGKKLQSFSLSISTSSQLAPTNLTPDPRPAANIIKRHRRARSQCLLASTLSLTNLSHLSTSSSPTNSITLNGLQLASSISSNYLDSSGAQETAKFVPILVAFMIDNAKELFGSDVMNLFGPRKPLQVTDNDVNREQQSNINESMATSNPQTKQSVGPVQQTSCTIEQPIRNGQDKRPGSCDDSLESKSIVVTRDQTQPHCSDLVVKLSSDSANNNNQTQQPISSPGQVHLFPKSKPVLVMHIGNPMEASKTSDQVTSSVGDGSVLPLNSEIKREPASDATTSILIVNTPKKQTLNQVLNLDHRARSDLELNHKQQQDLSSSYASQASDGISDEDLSTKRRRQQQQQKSDSQSADSFHVDCGGRRQCRTDSSSSSSPLIVANVDSDEHDEREAKVTNLTSSQREHKQQRPLSATESTTSSSRASSSTSGVHSESPAFSCERDSNSSASYSSVSPHNNASAQTTNTCSPTSSRCVSISPPSSSSSSTAHSNCTSPIEMDHSSVDVVDGNQHLHRHHLSSIAGNAAKTISHNEAMRHNLIGQVCSPQTLTATTVATTPRKDGGSVPVCESRLSSDRDPVRGRRRTSFERPKSMVSLNRPSEMAMRAGGKSLHQPDALRYLNDGQVNHQRYSSMAFDAVNKENVGYVFDSSSRGQQFQSHTLNRHTSASSQLVNINRMPKLPFQYTTSCYGGEAVLFYPPNAHLSQQQQQQRQLQQSQAAAALHQFGTPSVQPRGCNRIQSLDRLTQLHHSSSHLHQQQQPQRSHVMMLRDYYLSLQEQSQQQQQFRELMKRHQCKQQMLGKEQRPSVTNAPKISSHFQLIHQQQSQPSQQQQYRQQVMLMAPAPVDPRQQPARSNVTTNLKAMQTSNDATKTGCNGNHELMREQPASVAVAHQRVQPRTARIRPNQFSGLYVKRATSPMCMDLGNANLITLDHHHNRHQTSSNACKPLASGGNSTSNLMAVSQSSLSQQSSKMSSSGHSSDEDERDCSSDECSTGGWMESTMV